MAHPASSKTRFPWRPLADPSARRSLLVSLAASAALTACRPEMPVPPPGAIPATAKSSGAKAAPALPHVRLQDAVTIPPGDRAPRYYTVKSGDTLTSIARHFKVTVADLQQANGLDPGATIHPGLQLYVPSARELR